MSRLTFEEESFATSNGGGGLAGWLVRQGITKNEDTAGIILIVIGFILIISAIFLYNSIKHVPSTDDGGDANNVVLIEE